MKNENRSLMPMALSVLAISTMTLFLVLQIHINLTGSMPKGFYREVDHSLKVGDFVSVCLPNSIARYGKQRNYLGTGSCKNKTMPVVKEVIAKGGDKVELSDKKTDHNIGRQYTSHHKQISSRINSINKGIINDGTNSI